MNSNCVEKCKHYKRFSSILKANQVNQYVVIFLDRFLRSMSYRQFLRLLSKPSKPIRCNFFGQISSIYVLYYRQFLRLLWDFAGRSELYPLYLVARIKQSGQQFPSENGQCHGFEDDES